MNSPSTSNENPVKKYSLSCFVPMCPSTSFKFPNKIFLTVPNEPKLREKWMKAVRRYYVPSPKSVMRCCEDHFDLPNDVENWRYFLMMGGSIRLKKNVVPHLNLRFESVNIVQNDPSKKQKIYIEDSKKRTAKSLLKNRSRDSSAKKSQKCNYPSENGVYQLMQQNQIFIKEEHLNIEEESNITKPYENLSSIERSISLVSKEEEITIDENRLDLSLVKEEFLIDPSEDIKEEELSHRLNFIEEEKFFNEQEGHQSSSFIKADNLLTPKTEEINIEDTHRLNLDLDKEEFLLNSKEEGTDQNLIIKKEVLLRSDEKTSTGEKPELLLTPKTEEIEIEHTHRLNLDLVKEEFLLTPKEEEINQYLNIKKEVLLCSEEKNSTGEKTEKNLYFINNELLLNTQNTNKGTSLNRNVDVTVSKKPVTRRKVISAEDCRKMSISTSSVVTPIKIPTNKIVKNNDFLNEELSLKRTIQVGDKDPLLRTLDLEIEQNRIYVVDLK